MFPRVKARQNENTPVPLNPLTFQSGRGRGIIYTIYLIEKYGGIKEKYGAYCRC